MPVINNTKRVSFLVTGENKASIVAKILTGVESLPDSFIGPVNGILEWQSGWNNYKGLHESRKATSQTSHRW